MGCPDGLRNYLFSRDCVAMKPIKENGSVINCLRSNDFDLQDLLPKFTTNKVKNILFSVLEEIDALLAGCIRLFVTLHASAIVLNWKETTIHPVTAKIAALSL